MLTVKNLDSFYLPLLISLLDGDIPDETCEQLAKHVEERYSDGIEFDLLEKLVKNIEINADGSWLTHT